MKRDIFKYAYMMCHTINFNFLILILIHFHYLINQ